MRSALMTTAAALPPEPDLSVLPRYVDRQRGAEFVTRYFFPISHRTMERWPLTGKVVNGRLVFLTADLFAMAQEKMDAAPTIKGGPATANRAA
ncbi:hypothetical protein ACFFIC_28645 [Roseomonas vinacea]|uniref:Transcriptional regulator n=2 Tax=Muricoccus vinaceus TaxID=424704 RepID=A0ABV6J3H6_9PROT